MSLKYPAPPLGLVVPDVMQLVLLDAIVGSYCEGSLWLLFDGSHTPGLGDTTATVIAHQVTWPGVANPTATGWGSASIGSDSYAVASGPALSWSFNAAAGPVVVGGAFGLDPSGQLLGEELIPTGPVTLSVTGQVLPYTPQLSLRSTYPWAAV